MRLVLFLKIFEKVRVLEGSIKWARGKDGHRKLSNKKTAQRSMENAAADAAMASCLGEEVCEGSDL